MVSYGIPKETPAPSVHTSDVATPTVELPPGHPDVSGMEVPSETRGASRAVTWTLPTGWSESPGSGFRYATLHVPGPKGVTADLAVTVLHGPAGGVLANINRWRDQLGLNPVDQASLSTVARAVSPGGREMTLVNMVGREGEKRARLLAAIVPGADETWFFKMQGEDTFVASVEKDFMAFLSSLKGI